MTLRARSVPRETKELSAAVAQGKRDIAAGRVYEADGVLDGLEQLVVSATSHENEVGAAHPTHSSK